MVETIPVRLSEVREVFEFLEAVNHLFHQPDYFKDSEMVEEFANNYYKIIRKLYYQTIWNWLPPAVQKEYEER